MKDQESTHTQTLPSTLEVEVFKAGDYGPKGTYTNQDLDAIASSYKPTEHEAPVTLDHNQTGPAEGWVQSLRRVGNTLYATLQGISPKLATLIKKGEYKKRSIELYRSQNEHQPQPKLKAVTFLGAATPEVKGMSDPLFSEAVNIHFMINNDEESSAPKGQGSPPAEKNNPNAYQEFKTTLMHQNRWNPIWESAGLDSLFTKLNKDQQQVLASLLMCHQKPTVQSKCLELSFVRENEQAPFHGQATDLSMQRHQQALAFQVQEPTLSYVDALLRVSRNEAQGVAHHDEH
ncbi:MAG: hypothetical protein ACFCU1_04490 [Sumerlaeia bacterium]